MSTDLSWTGTEWIDLGADLQADRTVEGLAHEAPVLPGTATCQDLDRTFRRDHDASCAIVTHPDVAGLVGLVERSRFESVMSGPYGYGRSLHGRRSLADVTQWDALTVSSGTTVVEAASRAITRAPEQVQDHVLVTGPAGVRAVPMPVLLAAVARTLARRALCDPLTGLANRSAFFGRVEESCRRSATQPGHRTAVVYLDLDGFKAVNDDLGHDVGDALLRDVAAALGSVARPGDLVARLGGDEFAVCLDIEAEAGGPDAGDPAVHAVAVRLHDAVAALGRSGGAGQRVRVSAGVAVGGAGGVDPDELVRAADLAMYTGKRAGGDRVTGPVRVARSVDADPLLGTSIPAAAARGELVLRYQPIVDLRTGRPVSLEALVRWQHPRLGLLTPDAFLPAAARAGQLLDLDDWVLRTATAEFAAWCRDRPGSSPALNVNVSTDRLLTPGLCAVLTAAAASAGLPPHRVRVEVPEHLLVDQIEAATGPLTELRAAGFGVTFDDVGAGGTSLRHLREVRADGLKIDRSYVQAMADDDRDRALVQLLVDFADSTGLAVTAEGVETEAQREQLIGMGCRYGQGWLFGRPEPLPAAQSRAVVASSSPPPK
ncbi:putative bifunctional diguanylate cyclase/phosphodiesterase [Blastococcus sp. SYSU D00820]